MGRKSGILLIVAGALVFTPLFFLLGCLVTFWLSNALSGVTVAPQAYLFLTLEILLGTWLMARGNSLYDSSAR